MSTYLYIVHSDDDDDDDDDDSKGKGKGDVDLYSASSQTPLTRSDMDHTVLPANNTISAFTRKHIPGGAIMHIRIYLLIRRSSTETQFKRKRKKLS